MPKPKRAFRIFWVGGSNVNFLQDAGHELHLKEKLKALLHASDLGWWEPPGISWMKQQLTARYGNTRDYEIINCGGAAYGSHRLVLVVAEILKYEPDLVLFYEAHNEFVEREQLKFAALPALPLQRFLEHSAFCRLVRNGLAYRQHRGLRIPDREREQEKTSPLLLSLNMEDCGPFLKDEAANVRERMNAFSKNMELIVAMCSHAGIPLILGTAPSNLLAPQLCNDSRASREYPKVLELFKNGRYVEAREEAERILTTSVHWQATDLENDIIRGIAEEHRVPLADVESAIVAAEPHHFPGETMFIDDCHVSSPGKTILMQTYLDAISRIAPNLPRLPRN